MYSHLLLPLSLFIFLRGTYCQNFTAIRDAAWPYDVMTPFSYRTPSPINIDTDKVRYVNPLTQLKLNVGLFEAHAVTNTGYSVHVTVNRDVLTSITGGALGNSDYVFQELTYYWSPNFRSNVASDIDGVGSPLCARIVFRNRKYANAAIANKHRDGNAIGQVNIQVEGYVPNPYFESFANVLKSIKRAGSTVQVFSLPLFIWLDQIPLNFYYAYPGSYIEPFGSVQYDSATILQFPKSGSPFISIPQFQNFVNLLDAGGNPITNRLSVFPTGGRPVVQVYGASQNFIPTAA